MAITLDLNLISENLIDLNDILKNDFSKKFNIKLEKIFYMDNWNWENIQSIYDISNYGEALKKGKIIVVDLKSKKLKDLGIYIEKTQKKIIYNLWINTEGYPELDADVINSNNKKFFKKTCCVLSEIIKQQNIKFEIICIGMEAELQYNEDIIKMIENSDNMIIWIVENDLNFDNILYNYNKSKIEELDAFIYERRAN